MIITLFFITVPVGKEVPNWKWNDVPWVPDHGPLSEYQDTYSGIIMCLYHFICRAGVI